MPTISHLPPGAGVGFKPQHFDDIVEDCGRVDFIEVHAENYMGDGGLPHARLGQLRQRTALSVHGVGLSIGGAQALDESHLQRLARLCDRYEPHSVSEHLAWSTHDGAWFGDLLPIAYSDAALARTAAHVDHVQEVLQRRVLIENPSTYVELRGSALEESHFMAELSRRSGCGLLLDLNNVVVSCRNRGTEPLDYLRGFALERVGEVHLAGHAVQPLGDGGTLRIDDHGSPVGEEAWALLAWLTAQRGPLPTLVERDKNIPAWPLLAAEIDRVRAVQRSARRDRAA